MQQQRPPMTLNLLQKSRLDVIYLMTIDYLKQEIVVVPCAMRQI